MDPVALAVALQVPQNFLVGQEAAEVGGEGEVGEHHDLLRQVGPERNKEVKGGV